MVWHHYISRNYLVIVHVHVRYALLIKKFLAVPKSRLKTYGDRAFSVAAPKLWNELPLDLRSLDTINLFKKHLKTDLFKKAYNV